MKDEHARLTLQTPGNEGPVESERRPDETIGSPGTPLQRHPLLPSSSDDRTLVFLLPHSASSGHRELELAAKPGAIFMRSWNTGTLSSIRTARVLSGSLYLILDILDI